MGCGFSTWALSSIERWVQAKLKVGNYLNVMIFCPCNKLAAQQTTAGFPGSHVVQQCYKPYGNGEPLSTVIQWRKFLYSIQYGIVSGLRSGLLAHAHPIDSSRQIEAEDHQLGGASFHNLAWPDNQTQHGMPHPSIRATQPAHHARYMYCPLLEELILQYSSCRSLRSSKQSCAFCECMCVEHLFTHTYLHTHRANPTTLAKHTGPALKVSSPPLPLFPHPQNHPHTQPVHLNPSTLIHTPTPTPPPPHTHNIPQTKSPCCSPPPQPSLLRLPCQEHPICLVTTTHSSYTPLPAFHNPRRTSPGRCSPPTMGVTSASCLTAAPCSS